MTPRQLSHRPRPPSRQVLLLLLAIALPCAVLLGLGMRLVRQDRELAEKRLSDQRRAAASDLRGDLQTELGTIRAREIAALNEAGGKLPYAAPATAVVARLDSGRVILPWEADPERSAFSRHLRDPSFARLFGEAERAELVTRDMDRAVRLYRSAGSITTNPAIGALMAFRAARARAFTEPVEGRRRLSALIVTARHARDDEGVPIAAYAAHRLLALGPPTAREVQGIIDLLRDDLRESRLLTPSACLMLRDLAATIADRTPSGGATAAAAREREWIAKRCAALTQAQALASVPRVTAAMEATTSGASSSGEQWWTFGQPAWLVNVGPAPAEGGAILIAVWADSVLPRLVAESEHVAALASIPARDAEPVGRPLEGMWLGWRSPPARGPWSLQQSFYVLTLLVVVGVGILGAYLLWRDVGRELRLAALRSQFVASVTHELKTPLTSIRLFAETLREQRVTDARERTEYLDTIVSESQRLTRLLDNVLELSRIEGGGRSYRLEPHDAGQVVRTAARAMGHPLAQQGFTLDIAIDGEPLPVRCDPDAIEQAVLNLLANALKYSGDSREIRLSARRTDSSIAISVEDHGIGVSADECVLIFEKFHRAPTNENLAIPGAGLGLAIVQHVAVSHGGWVAVDSEPHRGSTFSIHLPIAVAAAAQSPTVEADRPVHLATVRS